MRSYFDHAATSPMPQPVLDAYTKALGTVGNPASQHEDGQNARNLLESARETLAAGFQVTPAEVLFTSGGTEAINLGIKGLYWQRNLARKRQFILVARGEHHATLDSVEWLAKYQGAELFWLDIDAQGLLAVAELERAIAVCGAENIALLTFLWVNNEVGTVQPAAQLVAAAKTAGIPTHIDAVAALGQFDISGSGAACLSVSAHKIGGPVSSGALLLARDQELMPLLHGGSQQRARSGTQDAAAACAFAAAFTLATTDLLGKQEKLFQLQKQLIAGISAADPQAILRGAKPVAPCSGSLPARVFSNVHFTFPGCQGDSLLFLLDMAGVSAATGSACTAGVAEVSHVLLSMGLAAHEAVGALRFTFNADTTQQEVAHLLRVLPQAVASARKAGIVLG